MSFCTINGRTVSYRLLGDKTQPLVILAHPLGMNQSVWDELLTPLVRHFRILSWDLPGHGSSAPWPEHQPLGVADLAQEVIALAEVAGASRFHFVGTSIGGVIGQQLLAKHSEHLLSATLTNTGAVIGAPDMWQARAERVRSEGLAALVDEFVPRWFSAHSQHQHEALAAGWKVALGRTDGESYARLCELLGATSFMDALPKGDVPVHLIAGADDVSTPPETLEALAKELGGAPIELLKEVGHVSALEAPDAFATLLQRWLSDNTGYVPGEPVSYASGLETRKRVLGEEHVERASARASSFDAPFQNMITRLAWGELWSNPDLTHRERSMITTAILAALGREELELHLRTAQRIGLSDAELRQVLMHVAVYAGVPAANHAFALARQHGWG